MRGSSRFWASHKASPADGQVQGHESGRMKRSMNPGVRIVGCRVYDSVNGKTCHWCRQKTVEDHVQCSLCTIKFCSLCLRNRHGEDIVLEMQEGNAWVCPKCRDGCGPGCNKCCNCGPCRKVQGLESTGMIVHLARGAGFTNVHDYLIFKTTGESPLEIARRKVGRGWCKSADYSLLRLEEYKQTSQSSPLIQAATHEQLVTTSEIFCSSKASVSTDITFCTTVSGEDSLSKWGNKHDHIERCKTTQSCPNQQQNRKSRPLSIASSQGQEFIRKKNINPGVRVVGCRIYDSVNGKSCHWCRQKTLGVHVHCCYCTNKFCGLCLKNRHGEEIMLEMQEGNAWVCPKCRNGCGPGCKQCCNCGPCRKLQGLGATGMVVHLARSAGFTNVHDYLIFKITGESPREISRRKIGRGWCRSADRFWSRPEDFGLVSRSSFMTHPSREYTQRMRGSLSKQQVKQLPESYSYLLPNSNCKEEKLVKGDPALSSSICSTLSDAEPVPPASASDYTQNSCIDFSKPSNCEPHNPLAILSKSCVWQSNQEGNDMFASSEPVMNRDPDISGSESFAEAEPQRSVLCGLFGRDMNDTIWAQCKEFEVPLEFRDARKDIDSDVEDEDYKYFMENVRVDGLSYALEFKVNEEGCTTSIKFEETEDGWDINGRDRGCEILHKCSEDRNLKFGLLRQKQELTSNCRNVRTYIKSQKRNCISDPEQMLTVRGKHKLEASVASKSGNKRRRRLTYSGESKHVLLDLKSAELPYVVNVQRNLRDERKSSLQYCSQQIAKAKLSSPCATSPSSVPIVGNIECRGVPLCIQSDDFKNKLKATLQEPFSTQQLHEMWNAVNHRKPIIHFRHTRQRTVRVETNQEGFSYLDYHPDLADSLESATAPEEKLTLLRGFFFWLKHASWPGAFQPWISSLARMGNTNTDDDDCVEVDGPDCEVVAVVLSVDERRNVTSFSPKRQLLHPPLLEVKKEKFQIQEDCSKILLPMNITVKKEIATH